MTGSYEFLHVFFHAVDLDQLIGHLNPERFQRMVLAQLDIEMGANFVVVVVGDFGFGLDLHFSGSSFKLLDL